MTATEVLQVALVYLMVPFVTVNPILFGYIHNWRKTDEGKTMMALFVSLALLVDFSVLFDLLPWFPGKDFIAVGVFFGLLAAFIALTVILVRELRAQRRRGKRQRVTRP